MIHTCDPSGSRQRVALITGGAGFVGSNLAERLLSERDVEVRVFDNLARPGVRHNLEWLEGLAAGRRLEFVEGDVRDASAVRSAACDATEIYHLAAQVAVTTSIQDPREDFEVNALGTFNALEAARQSGLRPFLLYTSTNKVYGALDRVPVEVEHTHYRARQRDFNGVGEAELLDFHSPYGCSKGAADQYVRDYARIYGIPTVVFRMSCIAGPRQFGTEDQGWVAHFLYSVLEGRQITVYGDGLQVRDVLDVRDLVDAMLAARRSIASTAGEIYNVGGGPANCSSVREMLRSIAAETGREPVLRYADVRPGDQPYYISDTAKLTRDTGWVRRYSLRDTTKSIHRFWMDHMALLAQYRVNAEKTADVGRQDQDWLHDLALTQ